MHILIAFLTALGSVLYGLDRLGIDIGGLNPWSWRRKRRWMKQYHANPAFSLEDPMDAIALLLTATAKIDGDLSSEEKIELRRIFEDTFKQTPEQASALLRSSTFLLGSGDEIYSRVKEVLTPSLESFNDEQKTSSLALLNRIASVGGAPNQVQTGFMADIESILAPRPDKETWH